MKLGIIVLAIVLSGCGGSAWGDLWEPIEKEARSPLDAGSIVVNVGDSEDGGCVR